MIQTSVSSAVEAAIYLRNFFDELKGAHAIIASLRDTLARLRYVLEAFPAHRIIDEGLRIALGELGGIVGEYEAEYKRVGGRARVVFSASQLIALTKLDERIVEYVEKRIPPVIFEKPPPEVHRIQTANQVNTALNGNAHSNHHNHHGHHGHHHHGNHGHHHFHHDSNHNTLAPHTSMAGRTSPQPSTSLQPPSTSSNKPKKVKSHTKAKQKRGNPYLGEMTSLSRQIRPRSEYSQNLAALRGVAGLQNVYSKSFSDLCFSKESSIEWQAFCDNLKPVIDKYWDTTHECCGPILSLVKQAMESSEGEKSGEEKPNDKQKVTKASYEKFTSEKSILTIVKETARTYLLDQWIRDTQDFTSGNLIPKLEGLLKKYGGMEFCKGFFMEAAGRCPDVVQLVARLLVKSLKNLGSATSLSSLSLAVQGLELLTRHEHHVLILLESGILPHVIEASYKLKEFATTAGTSTTYFPACFKLLSNLCATEQGAFSLFREDIHSWVVSALSPSWSSLFSEESAVAALYFFANFHRHVQRSNILLEKEVYAVVVNSFSKYKSCHSILDGICEFISTLKIDDLIHFGGTSGILVELCDALRKWGENENFDTVLLSKQFSLLAMLCANEKNAIQVTAVNIISTIVDFILHTKYKVGLEVLLPIFGVAGHLVEFFQPAKAFEQAGGMNALAAYLRGSPQPENFVAYCCVIHCYLPSALGSISSQYHVLSDCFAAVKANPGATLSMLRALALIAVSYDEYTGSIDAGKIGPLALEAMQAFQSHKEVQAAGCHVIAVWADRLRRITHGTDPAASLVAILPYVSSILSAGNSYPNEISVWGEGFFAISQLIVRDIPATVDLFGGPASERVDFTHVFKMCTVTLRNFSHSKLAIAGVSELVHKLCKLGEFSRQDLLKVGCDDQFLDTLLWAIEQAPSSTSCTRLLQILRILFHVKEMGSSANWCNASTSAVVFGMRKFGASPKLSRTGSYILHKITTINPSYGTSAMVEVALNALRHHSNVWDIPFRAGTLLLSLAISVASLRTVIAQFGGLPQLWSARKYFDISEANDRGFEKAISLLQHAITTASPTGLVPAPSAVTVNNMEAGGDFYYNNVYTQEAYGSNVRHEHIMDKVFQKSEAVLDAIGKILQTLKVEGWYIKNAIPRAKLTLLKQTFKIPAWEQPLALLECFPTAGQGAMTLYAMTSGMWYQNSGYTSCPFSERLEGFLTWADIAHAKLDASSVVIVGQASIEVGRALGTQLLNLFTEFQQFFKTTSLWTDVEPAPSTVNQNVNVRLKQWVGDVLSVWHDGIVDDDFVEAIKVQLSNSDKSVAVYARGNTRPLPQSSSHPSDNLRGGSIVEVHQPPIWIPAKVSDPLSRITIEEPTLQVSPTVSSKNPHSPTNANNKLSNKAHVIPHTSPTPTRMKADKHPSPQKRRAETSKDKRNSPTARNSPPPVVKKSNEENGDDKHEKPEKAEKSEAADNIDHKTKQALEASKWCDNDQEMVAAVYCHGCKMKLCDACDKSLHQHATKRSHYRKPFKSSAKIKCANDEENDAGLYCKGCEMHFCLECDIYLHKNPNKKGHERVIL